MPASRSRDRLGEHLCVLVVSSDTELGEGIKEVIVSALSRQLPIPHGPGVNQLAIEHGIREHVHRRCLNRRTRRQRRHHRRRVHTITTVGGPLNVRLGIDGPREMIVQVSALWHLE